MAGILLHNTWWCFKHIERTYWALEEDALLNFIFCIFLLNWNQLAQNNLQPNILKNIGKFLLFWIDLLNLIKLNLFMVSVTYICSFCANGTLSIRSIIFKRILVQIILKGGTKANQFINSFISSFLIDILNPIPLILFQQKKLIFFRRKIFFCWES